jgi:hypothetical protein
MKDVRDATLTILTETSIADMVRREDALALQEKQAKEQTPGEESHQPSTDLMDL